MYNGPGGSISGNDALSSLSGLDSLTSILTSLYVENNAALSSLSGLDKLTSIGEDLEIVGNPALTNLSGLDSLTSIGGFPFGITGLFINDNDALMSLSALNQLTSIYGQLFITDNTALKSLSGLDNIDLATISDMFITNNPNLVTCDVQSVCAYLQNNGSASISNNAHGCNDIPEIEAACLTPVKEPFDKQELVRVFPNPTQGELNIECDATSGLIYSIHSSTSIIMMSGQLQGKGSVDISELPDGLYFVETIMGNQVVIKKILKTA